MFSVLDAGDTSQFVPTGKKLCDALQVDPDLRTSLVAKEKQLLSGLLELTAHESEDVSVVALCLLQVLSFGDWRFQQPLAVEGIPHLVVVLSQASSSTQLRVVSAVISNIFALAPDGQISFAEYGGIDVLVALYHKLPVHSEDVVASIFSLTGNLVLGSSPCRHMLLEGDGVLVLTKYPLAICKENLSEHILIRYLRCMKTVLPGLFRESKFFVHEVVPYLQKLESYTKEVEDVLEEVLFCATLEIHGTFSATIASTFSIVLSGPENCTCHCPVNGPKLAVSEQVISDGILRWRFRFESGHNSCFLIGIVDDRDVRNERSMDIGGKVAMKNNGTSSSVPDRIDINGGETGAVVANMTERKVDFYAKEQLVHTMTIGPEYQSIRLAFTFWNNCKVTLLPPGG